MVRPDQHACGVRDHQSDEADRSADGDDGPGDGGGDEEEFPAQPPGVDAERGGGLVAHGEGVQPARGPGEVGEAGEYGPGGDRHGGPVGPLRLPSSHIIAERAASPRSAANTMNVVTAENP